MSENIVRPLAPDEKLRVGWCADHTDCLGPGIRFALWLQGCLRGCDGCIAPDMQPLDGGRIMDIGYTAKLIIESDTEGITISGGEPFYQANKLLALLKAVKSVKREFGVIVFSGYTYEQLISSGEAVVILLLKQYIDLLIDGEYIRELDDDSGLRGSSNQRFVFLTERYRSAEEQFIGARQASFFLRDNRIQMIGVPSQATKNAIARINDVAALIGQRKQNRSAGGTIYDK